MTTPHERMAQGYANGKPAAPNFTPNPQLEQLLHLRFTSPLEYQEVVTAGPRRLAIGYYQSDRSGAGYFPDGFADVAAKVADLRFNDAESYLALDQSLRDDVWRFEKAKS